MIYILINIHLVEKLILTIIIGPLLKVIQNKRTKKIKNITFDQIRTLSRGGLSIELA